MDKQEAIITLTQILHDDGLIKYVLDSNIKDRILKDASHYSYDIDPERPFGIERPLEFNGDKLKELQSEMRCFFDNVNYYFITPLNKNNFKTSCIITPCAIIGEDEKKYLREKYYSDVPDDIAEAFDILSIDNYISKYKNYIRYSFIDRGEYNSLLYKRFRNYVDSIEPGDIIKDKDELDFYILVKEIKPNNTVFGHTYYNLTLRDSRHMDHCCEAYNAKGILKNKMSESDDFIDFVFSLPIYKQNINANKDIIKHYIKYRKILIREYQVGENFNKYFDALDKVKRTQVVEDIKKLDYQNMVINYDLTNIGYKGLKLSHIMMCHQNPKRFIEYFNRQVPDQKRSIIEEILNSEDVDKDVTDHFFKNERELIQEVTFLE